MDLKIDELKSVFNVMGLEDFGIYDVDHAAQVLRIDKHQAQLRFEQGQIPGGFQHEGEYYIKKDALEKYHECLELVTRTIKRLCPQPSGENKYGLYEYEAPYIVARHIEQVIFKAFYPETPDVRGPRQLHHEVETRIKGRSLE